MSYTICGHTQRRTTHACTYHAHARAHVTHTRPTTCAPHTHSYDVTLRVSDKRWKILLDAFSLSVVTALLESVIDQLSLFIRSPWPAFYIITKSLHALWLVDQLWVTAPVNPWKNRASSKLLCKSSRPQVSMVYRLINHLGCWQNTGRIRKSLACGSWFTNSSRVLPTSRVVYQPITHRNLWSIA